MLRKLRIVLALIFILAISTLFVGVTAGVARHWVGWMVKIQFLPAVLALNAGIIVGLCLLTIIFGRVYCSVICPLGVYQDFISWLSTRPKKRRLHFKWHKEMRLLRYLVWGLFVAAIIAGVQVFVAVLAPYSAYGRMLSVAFGTGLKTTGVIVTAVLTFLVVTILSWVNGRAYCNSVCPVGTTLSFFSRFSLFRPVIDKSKCRGCRICERKCKSSCIDVATGHVDYSRCVDCFNCIDNCRFGAMRYSFAYSRDAGNGRGEGTAADGPGSQQAGMNVEVGHRLKKNDTAISPKAGNKDRASKKVDAGRRAFIATSAVVGAAAVLKAQDKNLDGALAVIIDKVEPERKNNLTPFGSQSAGNFYRRCTACQLCISECPNQVLRPSSDLEHFMQPRMSYDKGYCRPECTQCSQVCPAGAILPITPEEKTAIHIGVASVDYDLCVVNRDGVSCGNCARHCPVGAIMMVRKNADDPDSPHIPAVNETSCIGCGACENLCPSRPLSAITVNGHKVHINS